MSWTMPPGYESSILSQSGLSLAGDPDFGVVVEAPHTILDTVGLPGLHGLFFGLDRTRQIGRMGPPTELFRRDA